MMYQEFRRSKRQLGNGQAEDYDFESEQVLERKKRRRGPKISRQPKTGRKEGLVKNNKLKGQKLVKRKPNQNVIKETDQIQKRLELDGRY